MLTSMKSILDNAKKGRYGVAYFNATDLHMIKAYINAAETLQAPIIIGTSEGLLKQYGDFEWLAPLLVQAARIACIPVAIHLDHTYNESTIMRAIDYGFGSVMFDGSRLSYKENKKRSKALVEYAHSQKVAVELGLGCVGGLSDENGTVDRVRHTDPDIAEEFVHETECDFLAVSIGTVHGDYKSEPDLKLDLLQTLKNRIPCPLVLHGGSGLSDDAFKNVVCSGISKVNIYTDIIHAGTEALLDRKSKNYADCLLSAEKSMCEAAMKKIKVLGGANKASNEQQ